MTVSQWADKTEKQRRVGRESLRMVRNLFRYEYSAATRPTAGVEPSTVPDGITAQEVLTALEAEIHALCYHKEMMAAQQALHEEWAIEEALGDKAPAGPEHRGVADGSPTAAFQAEANRLKSLTDGLKDGRFTIEDVLNVIRSEREGGYTRSRGALSDISGKGTAAR